MHIITYIVQRRIYYTLIIIMPFPNHEEHQPKAYGRLKRSIKYHSCQIKGNYWQFLKDYYKLDYEHVRIYKKNLLKNKKDIIIR